LTRWGRPAKRMLDYFAVFTRGGVVLWKKQWVPNLRGEPVERLVSEVLLEDRLGERVFVCGAYALRWALANEYGLVFVAAFQKMLGLAAFADELLELAKRKFLAVYRELGARPDLPPASYAAPFTRKFNKLYERLELRTVEARAPPAAPATLQQPPTTTTTTTTTPPLTASTTPPPQQSQPPPRTFANTERGQQVLREQQARPNAPKKKQKDKDKKPEPQATDAPAETQPVPPPPPSSTSPQLPHLLTTVPAAGGPRGRRPGPMRRVVEKKKAPAEQPGKPVKERRVWEDEFALVDEAQFNRGPKPSAIAATVGAQGEEERVDVAQLEFHMEYDDDATATDDSDDDDDATEVAAAAPKQRRGVWSFFSGLTGGQTLERADLEPVVAKFREHLHAKNVAFEIADKLCESVVAGLVGKKLGTFQGVTKTARAALEETLTRILTPRRNIDILRDIAAHKKVAEGRPFSIVFMGVNGVGKSTNLAKVCRRCYCTPEPSHNY